MSFAENWMELEIIMLSEVNQIQKDKYYMFSLLCGILESRFKEIKRHEDKRGTFWGRNQ
jgi:hypothetical protein